MDTAVSMITGDAPEFGCSQAFAASQHGQSCPDEAESGSAGPETSAPALTSRLPAGLIDAHWRMSPVSSLDEPGRAHGGASAPGDMSTGSQYMRGLMSQGDVQCPAAL